MVEYLGVNAYIVHGKPLHPGSEFTPGHVLHGFRVDEIREVPEISLTAVRLEHLRTGAQYLHVARDDANNVFSVGFNTAPKDSSGVSHILEHTALCGSERYPVRDPFFKMLNRSMSTFMNAWTAHDYTQYPFATQNGQDYANLRDVYLDAVFRPLLRDLDFYQEGWRIERENARDPTSPWTFKGVVYNEMKGAFSDTESLFATRSQQALYPGCTYSYVSGGDPTHIPELTYEGLVNFHRRHYHPSNARFFSYGNLPLGPQLEAINAKIDSYERADTPTVPLLSQLSAAGPATRVTETGPVDAATPADRQVKQSVSFLTHPTTEIFPCFAMGFLSKLLLSGADAPLYQALIDTNMGAEYSANTGFNPYTYQSSFSVGLQGVRAADAAGPLEERITQVLDKVAQEGFSTPRIEALIHQIEMGHKHRTADFGMSLMQSISTGWFHGSNPIDLMEIDNRVARLRNELQDGQFFQSLVTKHLLENPRKLVYTMEPDADFQASWNRGESERLAAVVASLTPAQEANIQKRGETLLAAQDAEQDLGCLPTLTLADIPTQNTSSTENLKHTQITPKQFPVQWNLAPTNGISYLKTIATLPHPATDLPADWQSFVPLLCSALTTCGTTRRTMAELTQDIRMYTGGVSFNYHLSPSLRDPTNNYELGFSVGGHCLDANLPRMYDLIREITDQTDFHKVDRLQTLIVGQASGLWNSIAESGHSFARMLAASTLLPTSQLNETYNGFDQLQFLNRLTAKSDLTEVSQRLEQLRDLFLDKTQMRVAITASPSSEKANQTALEAFMAHQSASAGGLNSDNGGTSSFTPSYSQRYFPMPFASNFSAQSFYTVPFSHPDSPALQLLSKLMTTHFLHREIREKNGAYGGGAGLGSQNGLFSFFSYRDPNPFKSVETFRRACEWAEQREFTDREMTEAKLSLFSGIDSPLSVFEEGMSLFTYGITDELRQQRRDHFLSLTSRDVQRVAKQYLVPSASKTSSVIIGEKLGDSTPVGWEIQSLEATNLS
ncbi:presequence protease [Dimargaris cristalligena]|uniref:Presequence protease, mitochondrial n=1 Tax=Dimargaris cristalligena TaxID=215637 RepID=A0A4V1J596_9FUNG|nr:presequence protease [Dimargaris cristalligena]|eukprot:RKP38289.1 presequence protease [Dimargaris cristalligena]